MLKPLLLILLLSTLTLQASPEIKLTVRPQVTTEQTNAFIQIIPDEKNRRVILEWCIYKDFCSSTQWDVAGIDGERSFRHQIRFSEAGEWEVKARLMRSDDSQKIDTTIVIVL